MRVGLIYRVETWGDEVGVGATRPRYCSLGGVGKTSTIASPFTAANEYICAGLAHALGLPCAPGVIVAGRRGTGRMLGFVSVRFGATDATPPPTIAAHLVGDQPLISAGIVAFDLWISNHDRHEDNLAYSRGGKQAPIIFDHGHALLGPGSKGLSDLQQELGSDACLDAHCLAPLLSDGQHLRAWLDAIRGVHVVILRAICEAAAQQGALGKADANGVIEYLINRRKELLDVAGPRFKNLPGWGMM